MIAVFRKSQGKLENKLLEGKSCYKTDTAGFCFPPSFAMSGALTVVSRPGKEDIKNTAVC